MQWNELEIGVDAWVIQDGNYPDFRVGERRHFAIEYHPAEMSAASSGTPGIISRTDFARYQTTVRVEHRSDKVCVLDMGILAFQETKPDRHFKKGSLHTGELSLHIDPYFYFEYLHRDSDMPPLIYTWRIKRILIETAPIVEVVKKDFGGPSNYWIRDPSQRDRREIAETDAWNDDNGNGDYVLVCERLPDPPRRSSTQFE